ncbi:MAG: glycosyltransferase [Rickettsiales bacterium]|jgi:glycosyltransferase involved in cell wall biosynthesis|nr:glycosyltransferase [Rickettsiales bacterium]
MAKNSHQAVYFKLCEKKMNPRVSIIVPCYNVAEFLERGIGSLSQQTLPDIEIICVNDASTDDTLQVLEMLALHDQRIIIIDLAENGGVGHARNVGIESARGEFVGFMDPDDFVDPDFYRTLYDAAKSHNLNVAVGNIKLHTFKVKNEENIPVIIPEHGRKMSKFKKSEAFFNYHYTAIYNREFLNRENIRYPEGMSLDEDTIFETRVLLRKPDPMVIVPQIYYNYCRRLGTLNPEFLSPEKLKCIAKATDEIISMCNEAQNMPKKFYITKVFNRFYYITHTVMGTRITDMQQGIQYAADIISAIKKSKYKADMRAWDYPIYRFVEADDPKGMFLYFFRDKQKESKTFYLFGNCKLAVSSKAGQYANFWLFGIHLWRIKTEKSHLLKNGDSNELL